MQDQSNRMLPYDDRGWSAWPSVWGGMGAAAFLGLAALTTHLTSGVLPEPSGLFLFFAAVLLSAVRFGFWIGIASAFAAFAAFNFLFVLPLYTFRIAHPGDLVVLAEFLLVAGLTGFLAGRLREEADAAKGRAAVLEVLSSFASELAEAPDVAAIEHALSAHLAALALGPSVVLRPTGEALQIAAAFPVEASLDAADMQAADRAFRRRSSQDSTQPGWQGARFAFVPLVQNDAVVLVLGHHGLNRHRSDLRYREQAIEVICRQGNLAIERLGFAQAADEARITADRESLRASLLTSLSHDLRTPLATILGAITSLRELGDTLPPEARADLQLAIEEEAQRLSRYVDNLLQMTRLQAGLSLRLVWVDPGDVAAAAVARAARAFPSARITVEGADLPMIQAEAALLEQALFNLIDNAVKFSAKPALVDIACAASITEVTLTVTDHGPGIAPEAIPHIFTPFFRADPAAPGTGLGLTICHRIVQAFGGSLTAESPVQGAQGSALHIRLPLPAGPAR